MKQINLNIPDISSSVAIMVRHAERYPISRMENALELRLTPKGKEDAFMLGQSLSGFSPLSIYHSPVPRCKETADSIRDGILSANQQATVEGLLLDLGGPYITGDWYAVVNAIEEIGHSRFIRKWFDNELPSSLIMSLHEAAHIQLKVLINQLRSGSLSTINVTHDWNIMIMREYFLHLRHEDIGDPDYLDGLHAFIEDDRLHLGYHGTVTVLDLQHL